MNSMNIIVFEWSSSSNADSARNAGYTNNLASKSFNENFYEEQIDLLLYEDLYCLLTMTLNFCRKNDNYPHVC